MKTGIKVSLPSAPEMADLDFSQTVSGFAASAQNGMLNLGTRQGSDALHPDKGTALLSSTYQGYVFYPTEQNHLTALAAEQTRLMMRDEEGDPELRVAKVGLEITDLALHQVLFNAYFTNDNGRTIGLPLRTTV